MQRKFISIIIAVYILLAASTTFSKTLELTAEERSYLRSNPEIGLVGPMYCEPYIIQEGDDHVTGIVSEYFAALSNLLSTKIYIEKLAQPGEGFEMASSSNYYGFSVVADSAMAHKTFSLSDPIFYTSYTVFTNSGKKNSIKTEQDLVGKKIAVVKNHFAMIELVKGIEGVELVQAISPSEQFELLQNNDVDAILGYSNYHFLIKQHMLTGVKYAFSTSQTTSIHIGVNKDQKLLAGILNKAISGLPNGYIDYIIDKWVEKYIPKDSPEHFVGGVSLSQDEVEWLEEHSTIKVASLQEFTPFNFLQNNEPTGYSVEYMELIGDRLGKEIEFVTAPWRDLLIMLKEGEIDIIPHIAQTKEREAFVDYTAFDHISYSTGVAFKKNVHFKSITELDGKTVAIADKTFIYDHFKEHHPEITLLVTKNTAQGLEAVVQGQAYAVIGNLTYLNYHIQSQWYNNVKTVKLPKSHLPEKVSLPMGILKGETALLSILHKAKNAISDNEEIVLRKKWLLIGDDDQETLALTHDEQKFLTDHPTIHFRIRTGRPPFEFMDNGVPSGLAVDYLNHIGQKFGFIPEFVPDDSPLDAVLKVIVNEQGKFDTLPYLVKNKERTKFFLFGDTYLSYPMMIVSHQGGPYIGTTSDLRGKRVAIEKGFLTNKWIARDYPTITVVPAKTTQDALQMVNDELVDAYIGNLAVANYMMIHNGMNNLKVVAPSDYGNINYNFVAPKKWPELVSILNKGYRSLSPTDHSLIQQKWFSLQVINSFNSTLFWRIASVIGIGILCILYWNFFLQKEKRKTLRALTELQAAQDLLEEKNAELHRLSVTDSLTSINNRLNLDRILVAEFERARRYEGCFGIIMLDIDHFKDVNDTYGHPVGDQFLIDFTVLVSDNIRTVDSLGRWGGEEFLIICPSTNVAAIQALAEKLRKVIETNNFSTVGYRTASFGLSLYSKDKTIEEIIGMADSALYSSKKNGRNKVTLTV